MSLQDDITAISALIDGTYSPNLCIEARERRRIDKLGEELGEVINAYNGSVGENPRKGFTHDRADVLGELLDVAACALGAYESLTGNNGQALEALTGITAHKRTRLEAAVLAGGGSSE